MSQIDVSVIVPLHHEGKYLTRTLTSLGEAAGFARQRGIKVELVAVLDRADHATRHLWEANRSLLGFDKIQSVEVDYGSPGMARNAGCSAATGALCDLMDGDDLISYTMIAGMHEAAQRLGPDAILVPRFSFGFGARYYTVEYFSDDVVPMIGVIKGHPYTAKLCFSRHLFSKLKFADVRISPGYAHEDWHFNANAMALGYRFFAIEGTALFYRQRRGSQFHRATEVSTGQIPPSPLFRPSIFLERFADEYCRLEEKGDEGAPAIRGTGVLDDQCYREIIARANLIDPAVELGRYQWDSPSYYSNYIEPYAGVAYYRICEALGDIDFDAVLLLSGDEQNDALSLVASWVHSMMAKRSETRILALLAGAPPPGAGWDALLQHVILIELDALCARLPVEDRDLICLKLLQSCAAEATLHCTPSAFARRLFTRFKRLLEHYHITCYRVPDRRHSRRHYVFTVPTGFEFVSENIDLIDRIVAPDQETVQADRRRIPGVRQKWLPGSPPADTTA